MIDLIKTILTSDAGSVTFVAALVLGGGWLVYYATKRITEISKDNEFINTQITGVEANLEKKIQTAVDTLDGKFTYVTGNLEKKTDKIEGHIDEIRKDISFLKGALDIVKKANKNTLMQAHSPISLTEKGNEVSKELAVDDMLTRNWEVVYNLLEKEIKDKNPYDIQQSCIEELTVAPEKYLLPDDLLKVKNYAYNTGEPLALYTRLIAIVLRDRYFIAKGIEIADVDVFDPSKSE